MSKRRTDVVLQPGVVQAVGSERIAKSDVVQAFRPARRGGPEGPHYILQCFSPAPQKATRRAKALRYGIHAVIAGFALLVVAQALAGASQDPVKRSVWDGVYTAEQAKRGQTLYGESCASCHGTTLEGGEMAPPLAGGQFNSNWTGLSIGDLFERMRISMPQSNPGSLSRQQYADVLAYMLSGGSFPAGKIELPREVEALKQIAFEALRP